MKMRALLPILTCLLLAGCTSTQEAAPPDPPKPERAGVEKPSRPADKSPVIAVLGDSLAEGYGVAEGKSFPDQVQKRLDTAGLHYHVVNLGVSGDTTTGGLGRLAYALSLKPEVLLLELGGNDGLRGVPVAQTKANLEQMITRSQAAGTQVLLAGMTLPPNYGADYISTFENAFKDLAKKHRLPLIPFLMEAIRDQMATRPGLMQGDGIHPTAAGHELIADTVMHYLKPMLHAKAA